MIRVRPAVEADIPALVEMGRMLHAESPRYARMTFDADKVKRLAQRLIGSPLTAPADGLFVAENDERVIGMVAGHIVDLFFTYDKIATDYTFYVRPEHRRGRAAVLLLNAFEAWALKHDIVDIMPGASTAIATPAVKSFYEKRGYELSGYLFRKQVR